MISGMFLSSRCTNQNPGTTMSQLHPVISFTSGNLWQYSSPTVLIFCERANWQEAVGLWTWESHGILAC